MVWTASRFQKLNNRLQCQDGVREAASEQEIIQTPFLPKLLHSTVTPGVSLNLCHIH